MCVLHCFFKFFQHANFRTIQRREGDYMDGVGKDRTRAIPEHQVNSIQSSKTLAQFALCEIRVLLFVRDGVDTEASDLLHYISIFIIVK